MTRTRIGALQDFGRSSVTRVEAVDDEGHLHTVAVARIGDDFYAIGDRCSHADVSLSDGTLWDDECELECPKHGSAFSLRTGEPQSFPATRAVPVHTVELAGDDLFLILELRP